MTKKISKEDVREYILKVAKDLFLEKGYLNTSIRDIAKAGDLTLGRIYVYFKKKDDIFMAIIKPAILIIDELKVSPANREETINNKSESVISKEIFHSIMLENCNIIKKYEDEFILAFFKAEGFTGIDIREYIVDVYKKNHMTSLNFIKQKAVANIKNDELLIKTMANIYISIYEEILKSDMKNAEYEAYIKHMADFIYYGNLGLLGKLN